MRSWKIQRKKKWLNFFCIYLFDLLKSYSQILKSKDQVKSLTIEVSELYSVDQAIKRMREMFGSIYEWTNFLNIIPDLLQYKPIINKSIISSNFVKEITKLNGNINKFVTKSTVRMLKNKF